MFRFLSFLLVLFIFIGLILVTKNKKGFWQDFINFAKNTLNLTKSEKSVNSAKVFISIKMIVYFIVLICVVLLAISGFVYPLLFGESPSGILLLVHVTIAPVFAVGVAVLALLWAHNHSFNKQDWQWIREKSNRKNVNQESKINYSTAQKICFWLGLSLSLPVILSIVLSMFRYFGTYGQEYLFQIHRYGALVLIITVAFHSYFVIIKRN